MPPEQRNEFRGAVHLVPTWKQGDGVLYHYLQHEMDEPLAFMYAHFQTSKQNNKNCLQRESNFPKKQAICVGCTVMLLHNFLVSAGLMNGALGIVKDIHYEDPCATGRKDAKFYVVVDFPLCTLKSPLIPGCPTTYVPIPVITSHCDFEKCGCCRCTHLPLRVSAVLSIYKSQGQTAGSSRSLIKRIVAHLPTSNTRASPGSALVAMSRVTDPRFLAFGNPVNDLVREDVLKIGTTQAYATRRAWLDGLRTRAPATQDRTKNRIAALGDDGTYSGGCAFLLRWYVLEVLPPLNFVFCTFLMKIL